MADQARFDLSTSTPVPTRVSPNLDPRLQFLVARRQVGEVKPASADTGEDEVAVLARVTDPEAWENLSEVRTPTTIGPTTPGDEFIVAGRIPVRRIEAVRTQSFVKSLKAASDSARCWPPPPRRRPPARPGSQPGTSPMAGPASSSG